MYRKAIISGPFGINTGKRASPKVEQRAERKA
jgi:hypothetical protein